MIIRPLTLFCSVLAGLSGMILYTQKHKTTVLDHQIAKIVHDTERLKARTAMLRRTSPNLLLFQVIRPGNIMTPQQNRALRMKKTNLHPSIPLPENPKSTLLKKRTIQLIPLMIFQTKTLKNLLSEPNLFKMLGMMTKI